MFRFLKRNDSEVITPEVVDVPVMTTQSNIAMALALCKRENIYVLFPRHQLIFLIEIH